MLDPAFVRERLDQVRQGLASRGLEDARENAVATAGALTSGTPDVVAAVARQEAAAGALDDAWSEIARALHRERLRLVPTFRALTDDVIVRSPEVTADRPSSATTRATRPGPSPLPGAPTRRDATSDPRSMSSASRGAGSWRTTCAA